MRRQIASAFGSGLILALGLGFSGMVNPNKVLGFLDVFGHWDPTLAFVMMGAVGTYALCYRLILHRRAPLFSAAFATPASRPVDRPLVVGAVLFGLGWGLSGYCPGPVVVSLASGARGPVIFTAGMVAGMVIYGMVYRERPTMVGPLGAQT